MADESQSQFLSGTLIQFAWDSTSLGYLKRCPRLYYYHLICGWTTSDESVHLRFGIEYHRALQNYDLSRAAGIPHDDSLHDVVRELLVGIQGWDPDHKFKNRTSLVRTVIWYLEKFKDDPARTFIKEDGKPAVEQSFRFELDWGPQAAKGTGSNVSTDLYIASSPYILCGHLDRIVTFADELYVCDYKTTTYSLGSHYFAQYEPDNQMSLYTLAGKVVLHAPVKGVMIDAAEIKTDYTNFGRGFTYRTEDQIQEWLSDLRYWLTLAEQYAVAGNWPMNDTACGMYGGCRFRQICSKSPSVREQFLEGNFIKLSETEKWNPLKPR